MPADRATLLVCHSTGDTNALLEVAKSLPPDEQIYMFSIGSAATKILTDATLRHNITVIHANNLLKNNQGDYEDSAFTAEQLQTLKDYFQSLPIDRVLIGTPSKSHATTYLQMGEYFSNNSAIVYKAIFNDYLFEEPEHSYWLKLRLLAESPQEYLWLFNYYWLAPILEVANRIQRISPVLKTSIVGHTIFTQTTTHNNVDIREKLTLAPDEPFICYSGSKIAEDDIELIQAIFSKMQDNSYQQIKMIIGLHPGMSNMLIYLNQLSQLITENNLIGRVKYIVNNAVSKNLGENIPNTRDAILANLGGNDIAKASNGVVSVLPATLANQAYLDGLPVYIARDIEKAYLFSHYENDLEKFFSHVASQEKKSIYIEGVPECPIGEAIIRTGLQR